MHTPFKSSRRNCFILLLLIFENVINHRRFRCERIKPFNPFINAQHSGLLNFVSFCPNINRRTWPLPKTFRPGARERRRLLFIFKNNKVLNNLKTTRKILHESRVKVSFFFIYWTLYDTTFCASLVRCPLMPRTFIIISAFLFKFIDITVAIFAFRLKDGYVIALNSYNVESNVSLCEIKDNSGFIRFIVIRISKNALPIAKNKPVR